MEAAGPASPRLTVEGVNLRVSHDSVEAEVILTEDSRRFTGHLASKGGAQTTWHLAAAAAVKALQHYLQQSTTDQPAPRIELLDLATAATGIGHDVIHATIEFTDANQQMQLLGSALVRNDRCSTAIAAALDAANRQLARLTRRPLAAPPSRGRTLFPAEREREEPPVLSQPDFDEEFPAKESAETTALMTAEPAAPLSAAEELVSEVDIAPLAEPPAFVYPRLAAADVALGVEIGATSVRVAAVDSDGKVLAEERRPSRATDEPERTLEAGVDAARATVASLNSSADRLAGVGLAMSGRLRPNEGICVSCGDFPAWREVSVAAPFTTAFDLPVSLLGSIQAAALAETTFGAARGLSNLLFVRVGIDLEIAIVSNGRPLMLSEASPGQVGHMVVAPGGPRCACGEIGCWQAVAGRDALVARVVRDIGGGIPSAISAAVENRLGAVTPALICQMAASGDNVARSALEETGRYLALGLGNLITLFDPEAVIIGGAPSPVGAALRHMTEVALKASPRSHILSRCVLLSPTLGDAAPVLGAAAWAAQNHDEGLRPATRKGAGSPSAPS
jgi:glucokinase